MPHRYRVLTIVSVATFVASLDLFIVNIAFPSIQHDFRGTSDATLSWILSAYAIVMAALLVPAGRIAANINIDGGNIFGKSRDAVEISFGKSSLDAVAEGVVKSQGRTLVGDQYPDRGYYYRSDQFSFAKIGVPALYFSEGTDIIGKPAGWGKQQHDEWELKKYHQPSDKLEDGWNLVIFPEGGRSPDGWTQPFKGGAAYLARRTGRPVVPVYLHGTRHVLPKTADADAIPAGGSGSEARRGGRLRRSPISVLFGAPLTPDEGENAHRFSDRVEAAVATLAREVQSDWWQARRSVSEVDPVDGAETAHRGPDAPAWRRSWALDQSPASGRRKSWPE